MAQLKGWRYHLFIGAIAGIIGAALYPIVIHPMLNIEKYKKRQSKNREGINQEEIQPGNMKIWTDPFDRKK